MSQLQAFQSGKLQLPTRAALRAETVRRDFKEFVKDFWKVADPASELHWNWHMDVICDALMQVTARAVKGLVIAVPPGTAKALDHETPVLTTWGWKFHGDLQVGDYVFGPDGLPKRVIACTEPWRTTGYEVVFDDGASIVAAGDHLWEVERDVMSVAPRYCRGRKKMVVPTSDLRKTDPRNGWSRRPDRIAVCAPVQFPPKRLPIDPYTLGAWLGDGASNSGMIYAGEQDAHNFMRLGTVSCIVPPSHDRKSDFYHILVPGLQTKLRSCNLLNNKHIPADYLEASVEQRWELLQGLMDTDGTCATNGACSFSNKNKTLIDQVVWLTQSLGLKSTVSSKIAKLYEKSYGLHYRVLFMPPVGAKVFQLKRKQDRCRGNQNNKSRNRYVIDVVDVGEREVKCIQVEGSIYLAGTALVPTHNSLMVSVLWPAWEWLPGNSPNELSLFVSAALTLSTRDSLRMRNVVDALEYKEVKRLLCESNGDPDWEIRRSQKSKDNFQNTLGGGRLSITVGQKAIGLRGSKVVIDDPIDLKDVLRGSSERISERMKEIADYYDKKLYTRRNQMATDPVVLIMQRVSDGDLAGVFIERKTPGWMYIVLPAEFDPELACPQDIRTKRGELLDPVRLSAQVLSEARALMHEQYSAQYNQRPVPAEGGMFKKAWFDFACLSYPWVGEGYRRNPYVAKLHRRVLFMDTANKAKETSDPTVIELWGQDDLQNAWLLNQWREQLAFPDLLKSSIRIIEAERPDAVVIEENGSGIQLIPMLKEQFPGLSIFGIPRLPDDAKDIRASNTTHWWESGRVRIPQDSCPFSVLYRDEHLRFPHGKNDDQVDCTATALQWFHDHRSLFRHRVIIDGQVIEANPDGLLTYDRQGQLLHTPSSSQRPDPEDFSQRKEVRADQDKCLWQGLNSLIPRGGGW